MTTMKWLSSVFSAGNVLVVVLNGINVGTKLSPCGKVATDHLVATVHNSIQTVE